MGKPRKSYSSDLKWNVLDLYKSEELFNKALTTLENNLKEYANFKDHILDSAESLLKFLQFDTKFSADLEQAYIYGHIQNDEDTTNVEAQKRFGAVQNLYAKYVSQTSFVTPEILKSNYATIEKFMEEEPKLVEFKNSLKEIFKYQKHTLSIKEEAILSSLVKTFSEPEDIYSLLTDADMQFGTIKYADNKTITLDEKTYRALLYSPNRRVRKNAFQGLLTTYGKFKNTYASLLMSEVTNNNNVAKIRNYPSAKAASLYKDDIPLEVYDNLIATVKEHIAPLSKFWLLKKKCLGLKELHIYDTYASITKEFTHKYKLEDAQSILNKALSVLGDTYLNDFNKAFKEHWIDFCPNDGKRNGAYCTACYNVHPYVLLSYDETLNSLSTLAHEMGHAMHYYYAIQNQKYQDYGYSIFVAEVASQVNQILLNKYLISQTNNVEEKKFLIDDLIQDFKSTLYRQTMFAEFESIIHEKEQNGETLTHQELCNIYYNLNKEYYGQNIVIDEEIKYEWERIPHFYMNYYVYQYATAYAAAIKIAMDLLNHKEHAQENYLRFLSLGSTLSPIESLKVAGVDMSKKEPIEEAFVYFNDLVEELTSLYSKKVK